MEKNDDVKYIFVILGSTDSPVMAIKTILFEQKILSKEGVITFYAPYNELCVSYENHFGDAGMWGVGFSLAALNAHKQIWDDGQHHVPLEDGGWACCQMKKDIFNFSVLDRKDYFFVAPKLKAWEEIWFDGYKPGTEYKQWWCKGLHKRSCYSNKDQEITDYLDESKKPFRWNNKKNPKYEDIFPQRNLIDEYGVLSHNYSLLNLTPKKLHERGGFLADVSGQMLF